jgi:hypothetical protein
MLRQQQNVSAERAALCDRFRQFHESFYLDLLAKTHKRRWADGTHRMLDRYIAVVDVIHRQTPRYVLLVRHGLDSAISATEKFPQMSLEAYLHYWSAVVDLHRAFAEAHPKRCLCVRYEDLVVRPQVCADVIFGFLGELSVQDIERAVFGKDHGPKFGDHKILQTNGFHADSIGRWERAPRSSYSAAIENCSVFNEAMMSCGYNPIS